MIAELVQWANEEFGSDGWSFRSDADGYPSIRFVHGRQRDDHTRIVIMVTGWVVTWDVYDAGPDPLASGRLAVFS